MLPAKNTLGWRWQRRPMCWPMCWPPGPLRVSSANPRYFADGTGKVVYLTGSHTWANFQDNGSGNPPAAFDYAQYLDFLTANNHNFFRLWTWEQSRWTLETSDDNYWFNPQGPYVRSTGQGNALDGQPKWDVSQFDQAYFDRMRQRIVAAGQRGMYVSIMLFDGWSVVSDQYPALNNPWQGHPYNAANNINGVNGDVNDDNNGREVHTLANPAVTALQEAYVKKVIDTVNDLDNVLYEIANEAPDESIAWQYHLIDYIKAYEAGKPKQHPVGMTGALRVAAQRPAGQPRRLDLARRRRIPVGSAGKRRAEGHHQRHGPPVGHRRRLCVGVEELHTWAEPDLHGRL